MKIYVVAEMRSYYTYEYGEEYEEDGPKEIVAAFTKLADAEAFVERYNTHRYYEFFEVELDDPTRIEEAHRVTNTWEVTKNLHNTGIGPTTVRMVLPDVYPYNMRQYGNGYTLDAVSCRTTPYSQSRPNYYHYDYSVFVKADSEQEAREKGEPMLLELIHKQARDIYALEAERLNDLMESVK